MRSKARWQGCTKVGGEGGCTSDLESGGCCIRVFEEQAASTEEALVSPHKELYCQPCAAEGVRGCRLEFLAYRILYQAVHAKHGEILQLLNTLKRVSQEVSHAVTNVTTYRQMLCGCSARGKRVCQQVYLQ